MSTEERLDLLESDVRDLRRRMAHTEVTLEQSVPILVEIRNLLDTRLGGIVAHLERIDGHLVYGHLVEIDGRLGTIEQVLRFLATRHDPA